MGLLNFFRKKETEGASPEDATESPEKPETETPSTVNTEALKAAVPPEGSAEPAPDPSGGEGVPVDPKTVEEAIVENLKTIYDPEIPVNIHALGLIYEVKADASGMVDVVMTLTAPNCPAAGILPGEVESKARSVPGVKEVKLNLTFDPPWNPEMMSEAAKLELGML